MADQKTNLTRLFSGGPADRSLEAYAAWISSFTGAVNPNAPSVLLTGAERAKTEASWKRFWEMRDSQAKK